MKLSSLEEFQERFEGLIERLKKSEIEECISLSKTYKNWKEEILNSNECMLDNGFLEVKFLSCVDYFLILLIDRESILIR